MTQLETNIYNKIAVIPVSTMHGKIESVTLRELLLNASQYTHFAVHFIENIVINHFITLIGRGVSKKNNEYEYVSPSEMLNNIVNTLDEYAEHFQLAGPKYYFLQHNSHEELMQKDLQSIAKLCPEIESGNNGNFFTKASDINPNKSNLSEVFFALLQGHLISYGGTGGGFKNLTLNFTDTIAARPISVFIKKETLAETFFANINAYNCANDRINDLEGLKLIPIWECSDHGAKMLATFKTLTGAEAYQKFGYERLIKIFWQTDKTNQKPYAQFMTIAQGIHKSDDIEEAYPNLATTLTQKNEKIYLKPQKDKAIWRSLDNILQRFSFIKESKMNNCLYNSDFEVQIFGLYSDKAKVEGSLNSSYRIPAKMLTPENLKQLEIYLKLIEKNANHLYVVFKNSLQKCHPPTAKELNTKEITRILNTSSAFNYYWFFMAEYFTKFSILEKVIHDKNFFENELKFKIKTAKNLAAEKFIQDFSDKISKYKLMGFIYKEVNYVNDKL